MTWFIQALYMSIATDNLRSIYIYIYIYTTINFAVKWVREVGELVFETVVTDLEEAILCYDMIATLVIMQYTIELRVFNM